MKPQEVQEIPGILGVSKEKQLEILTAAIDASNNCITIGDANQKDFPLIYVNKGFVALTGYSREEALGRNCRFLQNADKDQPGVKKLRDALKRGEDVNVIIRNYKKDGTMFWNELYISAIYNADGVLTHFMGVQNDVTKRMAFENSLREAIEASLQDASWLTQSILDHLARARDEGETDLGEMPSFTERESIVLELLAKGFSNIQIAKELDLSVHTVRNYIASLYDKLGMHNRVQVVVWARERGIGLS